MVKTQRNDQRTRRSKGILNESMKQETSSDRFYGEIKIPKDRVAVLIGTKGITKRMIEKKTGTQLKISKEGEVLVGGEDNLHIYITTTIVRAIGRGFNPDIAVQLWKDDIALEIVDIRDFSGKSEKKLQRIKARLIGTKGKAWITLEKNTNTSIVVYGKTVAIIGKVEDVQMARRAVEKLMQGAPHSNVYNFIDTLKKHQ